MKEPMMPTRIEGPVSAATAAKRRWRAKVKAKAEEKAKAGKESAVADVVDAASPRSPERVVVPPADPRRRRRGVGGVRPRRAQRASRRQALPPPRLAAGVPRRRPRPRRRSGGAERRAEERQERTRGGRAPGPPGRTPTSCGVARGGRQPDREPRQGAQGCHVRARRGVRPASGRRQSHAASRSHPGSLRRPRRFPVGGQGPAAMRSESTSQSSTRPA